MPSPPRTTPTQERARRTVEAIEAAAAKVLAEEGFAGFNTNRVAQVAGVNVATLYRYFATKADLVASLWRAHCASMYAVMDEVGRTHWDAPVREAMAAYFASLLHLYAENPALQHELRYAVAALGLAYPDDIDDAERVRLREYLEAHRNELRRQDLDLAVFVVVGAINHLTNVALMERPGLIEDGTLEAELLDLVERYLIG